MIRTTLWCEYRAIRLVFVLISALSLAAAQGAQTGASEVPIRNLSLVALDSRGQSVTDLRADELVVSDAGKTRKIAFVRHIERRLAASTGLTPGELSNRSGAAIPHATAILLDLMNQNISTRGVAANQLVKYLQTAEDADCLYLYILTIEGKLFPVRGLPGDGGTATTEDGAPWTRNIKATMDNAMRTVTRLRPVDMDVAARVQRTYAALESMGARMSAASGRKNLVWITDGVPISLGPIAPIQETWSTLLRG